MFRQLGGLWLIVEYVVALRTDNSVTTGYASARTKYTNYNANALCLPAERDEETFPTSRGR